MTLQPKLNEFEIAIVAMQSPLATPFGFSDESSFKMAQAFDCYWEIVSCWVKQKKWGVKSKLPCNRALSKQLEPVGELLFRELELCIQCHSAPGFNISYRNAAEWFAVITRSARRIRLKRLAQQRRRTKTEVIQINRLALKDLKRYENPYKLKRFEELLGEEVTLWLEWLQPVDKLTDVAIAMAEKSGSFCKDFWRPYLRAYSRWIAAIDSRDYQVPWIENDQVYVGVGSGRGRILFFG